MSERPPNLPEQKSSSPIEPIPPGPKGSGKPPGSAPSPETPKPSLSVRMRRWLPRFQRSTSRDTTGGINISGSANVQVQGDLVAGDKVFNVGTLSVVVPTRFFIILIGLALLTALGVWYVVTPDKMPTGGGSFNIAVAEFGVQDAQGNVSSAAGASSWSKWMFDTLLNESKQLPPELKVTVWHDSLRPFQERANIGLIQGKTPGEREKTAEAKARELQADLLIYGNFATNQTPGTFVPEFYLAKGRDEADEMRGAQAMGKPFELPRELNPADQLTRRYLERNLTPRAVALAWFVPGLIDDLSGDFESAHAKFVNGLAQARGLQDDQGKAVFYYYLGRQALFLSQDKARATEFYKKQDPNLTDGTAAALVAAEDAFREALRLDPAYARAYFGLGGVFFQRANLIMGETFGGDPRRAEVPALLAQAIQQHERALELAVTAPDSLIDIQSRLQLGFDYYQQGRYALDEKQFGLAEQALMRARAELETGLNQIPAEQHRLLTQAHLAIATTEYHLALARAGQNDPGGAQSHYRSAIQAYDACIAQAAALPEDSYLGGLRRTCEQVKQIAQQALGN